MSHTQNHSTCNCAEMSCKEDCSKNHTHKGFSCEQCQPQNHSTMEGMRRKPCTAFTEHENWCDCGGAECWEEQLRIRVRFDRNQDREVCILFIHRLLAKERERWKNEPMTVEQYEHVHRDCVAERESAERRGREKIFDKILYLRKLGRMDIRSRMTYDQGWNAALDYMEEAARKDTDV